MRNAIGSRDLFTGIAIVLSVAALAKNGPPDWDVRSASARPQVLVEPTDRPGNDREKPRANRNRRFNDVSAQSIKVDSAEIDTLDAHRVNVSEFIVSDQDGLARATINVDGGNILRFRAGSDKTDESFLLSVFPDGRAAFLLKDDRGRNRVALAIAEDGRPFLNLSEDAAITFEDERGRNRLVMRLDEQGHPSIRLDDHKVATKTISESVPLVPRNR